MKPSILAFYIKKYDAGRPPIPAVWISNFSRAISARKNIIHWWINYSALPIISLFSRWTKLNFWQKQIPDHLSTGYNGVWNGAPLALSET